LYKKILMLSIILPLLTNCSNRPIKKDHKATKQNETITESSFLGKLLIGTLTFYGTKGNIGKALKATKFGGNASGYLVGKKLSDMQKRYKEKEEELISNILQIDEDINNLKTKNNQLLVEIVSIQKEINTLGVNAQIRKRQKLDTQVSIKHRLQKQREKLQLLLISNKQVSKKIAFSKSKANEYDYTQEDKKEILQSVTFLEKESKDSTKNITKNIASIDKLISTL